MSFLDHLEELRVRIFRALAAVTLGFIAGWFIVERFRLVTLLKSPIAPYLPDGKLVVLSPTEPLMIVLKLAFILGCILSSPIVIWEVWGFLSPALYARERRVVVPALFVGVLLFLSGAALAFIFVVPQALEVLFSFQTDALATMITFEKYFDFVVQLMIAMGISFELPLVIIILASFGLVTPAGLSRFRRAAIVLSLVAGAILSPGTDVFSMLMLSVPLILLYEVGFLGSVVIWRRKLRTTSSAGLLLFLLFAAPGRAEAQVVVPPKQATVPRDTTKPRPGQAVDSASARRLGLPSGPSKQFPANDTILDALLRRPGYESTRFQADSATLYVQSKRIDLVGGAMTERNGSILEAEQTGYEEASCVLNARGDPKVFDNGTVLVGEGLRYNTCERRAVVSEALTNFQEGGVEWFMRGNISQDSTAKRIYASGSALTSCDLPVSHYHFEARQTKWISKTVLVARPAVLYVRDVPLLWLPFIFQDARPGRRSGILVPQFGINDIVRPSSGYQRQVTNIGYYWAPSDYFDATGRFDWYSGRYYQWGVGAQYRWLDRFTQGSASVNRQVEDEGTASLQIRWNHTQAFSLTSNLNLNLDFVSNTEVRNSNAINTSTNTQQIVSGIKYTKRFAWGNLDLGGSRRQSLTEGSIDQTFPTVNFTPNAIAIGNNSSWSPSLSFSYQTQTDFPASVSVLGPDSLASVSHPYDAQSMNFDIATPLRFGGFTWNNSFRVVDAQNTRLVTTQGKIPNDATPDPNDSVTVTRVTEGDFSTGVDWTTGINLPVLFRGTWKMTPSVSVANVTGGPFLLRNKNTGGEYVAQSKRARFGVSSTPNFFAFFPGFGPISRIRHSFQPSLSWNYEPEAQIPEAYARAVAGGTGPLNLTARASQTASIGLTQTFEAKSRPAPGDTSLTPTLRKYRLLSLTTSAVQYDFERAKEDSLSGWVTSNLTNQLQSDLIPGLSATLTHSLWRGTVGTSSAVFDPALIGVSASFSVSAATFRGIGRLFGIGSDSAAASAGADPPPRSYVAQTKAKANVGTFDGTDQMQRSGRRPFSTAVSFSLNKARPDVVGEVPDQVSLGLASNFSPTPFWSVGWNTQYDITKGEFVSHLVTLERDLHEWRASFTFSRNPNGNYALFFSIALLDLPDIKFDYNQTSVQ